MACREQIQENETDPFVSKKYMLHCKRRSATISREELDEGGTALELGWGMACVAPPLLRHFQVRGAFPSQATEPKSAAAIVTCCGSISRP
jgi:hypothetical protein